MVVIHPDLPELLSGRPRIWGSSLIPCAVESCEKHASWRTTLTENYRNASSWIPVVLYVCDIHKRLLSGAIMNGVPLKTGKDKESMMIEPHGIITEWNPVCQAP